MYGVTYVGQKVFPGARRLPLNLVNGRTGVGGDRDIYFYTVIPPHTELGREMKLDERRRIATVLYKWNPSVNEWTLIHVDELRNFDNLKWDLKGINSLGLSRSQAFAVTFALRGIAHLPDR